MTERALGPYRLISQIATGGMAEIYAAQTSGMSGFVKRVALKVIHPNYSSDGDFIQMLVDEAKLAVQLQHANIVQTFDLGRVDDQYYIAMELIDGVDLYRLLRRAAEEERLFPFEVAAFIAHEICIGLDYAHRQESSDGQPLKIVHRDISPQNILVSHDGEVKIVDFGIAKAALRSQNTAHGVIKGKYFYMSPEQAWGDRVDARTDIFSAGVVLYEMLIGRMLYVDDDLEVLLDKVRKAHIPPLSDHRPDVPVELEQVVMRALRKRPEERFQSAGEFAAELSGFLRKVAPDFTRNRLAGFVRTIWGPRRSAVAPAPRGATSPHGSIEYDDNSLLLDLSAIRARSAVPAAPPPPRRAHEATRATPTRGARAPLAGDREREKPSLERRATLSDFEGGDSTVVDPAPKDVSYDPLAEHTVVEKPRTATLPSSMNWGVLEPYSDEPTRERVTKVVHSHPLASPTARLAEEPIVSSAPPPTMESTSWPDADTSPESSSIFDEPTYIPPRPFAPRSEAYLGQSSALKTEADASLNDPSPPVSALPEEKLAELGQELRSRSSLFAVGLGLTLMVVLGVAAGFFWHSLRSRGPLLGTIEVASFPRGASVSLDGLPIDRVTPLEVGKVNPQKPHRVAVSLRGYGIWESDVNFEPGADRLRVQAVLVPVTATIEIISIPPGAEAIVNGRVSGTTPTVVNGLSPNEEVVVELRHRGYKVAVRSFSFGEKGSTSANSRRVQSQRPNRWMMTVTIPLEKVH